MQESTDLTTRGRIFTCWSSLASFEDSFASLPPLNRRVE